MSTNVVPPQAFTKVDLSKAYRWLMKQEPVIQEMATTPENLVGLYRKALLYGASSIAVKKSPSTNEFQSELKDLAGQISSFESESENSVSKQAQSTYSTSVTYQSSKGLPPWAEAKNREVTNSFHTGSQTKHREESNPSAFLNSTAPIEKPVSANKPGAHQQSFETASPEPQLAAAKMDLNSEYSSHIASNIESVVSANKTSHPIFEPPKASQLPELAGLSSNLGLDSNSRAMLGEIRRKMNLSSDSEALRMMIAIGYEKLKQVF